MTPTQRQKLLHRAGYRCEHCAADYRETPRRLHIHHKTALAYFREYFQDFAVICDRCHGLEHKRLAQQ